MRPALGESLLAKVPPISEVHPEFQESARVEGYVQRVSKDIGTISLSDRPDIALLWSLYATGFHGFAIGLKTAHEWWNNIGHAPPVAKVKYQQARIRWDEIPTGAESIPAQMKLATTKSLDWEWQREYRAFGVFSKLSQLPNAPKGVVGPFPLDLVSEVVVGIEGSTKTSGSEETVESVIRKEWEGSKIPTIYAMPADCSFGVKLVPGEPL